jgi:hypothetical protein
MSYRKATVSNAPGWIGKGLGAGEVALLRRVRAVALAVDHEGRIARVGRLVAGILQPEGHRHEAALGADALRLFAVRR